MIDANIMLDALEELKARYSAPERHYHNLSHINDLFEKERVWRAARSGLPDVSPSIAWAIWFHDAVYDVHASDNEEKSAQLASLTLLRANVTRDIIFSVADLILSTKKHVPYNGSEEASMFLDLDLSILGSSPTRYWEYVTQVRKEYDFAPSEIFYPRRLEVLQNFNNRPALFMTGYAQAMWEKQARKNIQTEIDCYTEYCRAEA